MGQSPEHPPDKACDRWYFLGSWRKAWCPSLPSHMDSSKGAGCTLRPESQDLNSYGVGVLWSPWDRSVWFLVKAVGMAFWVLYMSSVIAPGVQPDWSFLPLPMVLWTWGDLLPLLRFAFPGPSVLSFLGTLLWAQVTSPVRSVALDPTQAAHFPAGTRRKRWCLFLFQNCSSILCLSFVSFA